MTANNLQQVKVDKKVVNLLKRSNKYYSIDIM